MAKVLGSMLFLFSYSKASDANITILCVCENIKCYIRNPISGAERTVFALHLLEYLTEKQKLLSI